MFIFPKKEENLSTEERNLLKEKRELLEFILNDDSFYQYLLLTLVVIILNEICFASENNPEINLNILEYLISNFGINFISCIPAIYDKRLSFGPFQLTDLVVGKNTAEKIYPITTINLCLSDKFEDYKLPNNLAEFRNQDHYQGVIFLCIYYLCKYIKNLDETKIKELKDLTKQTAHIREEFYKKLSLMFCSCHHNGEAQIKKFIEDRLELDKDEYLERSIKNFEIVEQNLRKKVKELINKIMKEIKEEMKSFE
ncbi:MAG: hypothetical protein KatS3mg094_109 [Candidatus Parcubacteria bacterium]|nr:MAG: hypothetical protein KatS3mg094_109 [Candidatus Parcubacteria bacterium]